MNITIKVYGRYKDITKKDTVQLEITKGDTIKHVVNAFVKQYPATEKDKTRMMVSKNKMYVSYETKITEKDEITLSPPVVSGG
jgi:molybdopterin converting factor small subunit